ncbi:MAG: Hsp20/alpha crystallin family protein [Chloroflexi bacterium]|nr:MAG: Hsp20/alpha crystallin family protein [Chloroflexota bacterium]
MTLVRWNPTRTMSLFNEFERMFDEAFNMMSLPQMRTLPQMWQLALDVAETDDGFIVKASVPGVNPDDLEITLENNLLTIKGELKEDQEINQEQYHLRERRYGTFSRSITLPVAVNSEEIEATYENGVLRVFVPKAEEVKPKRISIKAK